MIDQDFQVDFAMSYAGEDYEIVNEIARRLRELRFLVFCARDFKNLLVGFDGEHILEAVFKKAKAVVVFISENYKNKDWPRFEWDIIKERDYINRFIPVRLDNAKIIGLPSNIFYVPFKGKNYSEIVDVCVEKLLSYEHSVGITRPSEYKLILNAIKNESKGALATAYQLVKDKRTRTPLEDCELPKGDWEPSYKLAKTEWYKFSKIIRLSMKIIVPPRLSKDELIFNLKQCAATQFNALKPDAVAVLAYKQDDGQTDITGAFNAGRLYFAPFGKWGKALDGFAYNIPTSEFEYSIDLLSTYFKD